MGEFQYSLTIQSPPDELFAFVANVRNLPTFLPIVRHADAPSHGRVWVRVTLDGQSHEAEGYVLTDSELRRMEWGTDGAFSADRTAQYRGWLQVVGPDRAATSRLIVHLAFPRPSGASEPSAADRQRAARIEDELARALHAIQQLVERSGARAESASLV